MPVGVTDGEIVEILSLSDFKLPHLSVGVNRRVVAAGVPERVRKHPDYVDHRWIWVSINESYPGAEDGRRWPLVLLDYRLPITQRECRVVTQRVGQVVEADGLNLSRGFVVEPLEGQDLARRLLRKGVWAWSADRGGNLVRVTDDAATTPEFPFPAP